MLERRSEPEKTATSVTCRVCYAWVQLDPGRIEDTGMYVYYRCQRCDGSFPIRRIDAEAALEADAAAAPQGDSPTSDPGWA